MTGHELRHTFLSYFEGRGHRLVRSSPLVPRDDPTLLFTNAGMVQFKDLFTGRQSPPYRRAASAQKCMRAGGKHNDLEIVGHTTRHHTFFEMLGNFSFGDYFKEEAITLAWEFFTQVLHLAEDRLWVSIYESDEEAYDLWQRGIGVAANRLVRLGEKENFWAMGETGPCGPCSEILIDQGPAVGCRRSTCSVTCGCDRYLELWNLVFMQYNRDEGGRLVPLPSPSIDTGLGLERMAAILQGVTSNYDTDLFRPIIQVVEELAGRDYGKGGGVDEEVSFRVIADHLRAIAFLIADGVLPANEGRGYVLRRVIRRAARHGRRLGIEKPFLYRAVGAVVEAMQGAYPELAQARRLIAPLCREEEERFGHTLRVGLRILNELVEQLRGQGGTVLPGEEAFRLYDTYGFPLDLTREILQDSGLTVDEAAFWQAMERQRQQARAAWKGMGEVKADPFYQGLLSPGEASRFVGYTTLVCEAVIQAVVRDRQRLLQAEAGEEVEVVLDVTPFYAEAGGQIGDQGWLRSVDLTAELEVTQTSSPLPGLYVHRGVVRRGRIRPGDRVMAEVDGRRRQATARNHSATHLLHAILRQVLGDHVKQCGSLVAPDRLRFDFTHFAPLSDREIRRIEQLVNERIMANLAVGTQVMDLHAALELGAMALFGEKYGEEVRVVRMADCSAELCGGTHVQATGEIGPFKITHEGGIAAGVRRIEAVSGEGAHSHMRRQEEELVTIRDLLKAKPFEESARVSRLQEQLHTLEKELQRLKAEVGRIKPRELLSEVRLVEGVQVLALPLPEADPAALRSFIDTAKARMKSGLVVVGTIHEDKVALAAGLTADLTSRLHAGRILQEVAAVVGGRGGGRPDLAEAGGREVAKLPEALAQVYGVVARHLSGLPPGGEGRPSKGRGDRGRGIGVRSAEEDGAAGIGSPGRRRGAGQGPDG